MDLVKSNIQLDRYGRDITKYPIDYTDQVWNIIYFKDLLTIVEKYSFSAYYLNNTIDFPWINTKEVLKECSVEDAFEDLPLWFIENYYNDLPKDTKFAEFECYV